MFENEENRDSSFGFGNLSFLARTSSPGSYTFRGVSLKDDLQGCVTCLSDSDSDEDNEDVKGHAKCPPRNSSDDEDESELSEEDVYGGSSENEFELSDEDAVAMYTYGEKLPPGIAPGKILEGLEPDSYNGRFLIEEKLGRGGFAMVWKARDLVKDTFVALKVQLYQEDGEYEKKMHNEIRRSVQDTEDLALYQDSFVYKPEPSEKQHWEVLSLPLLGLTLCDAKYSRVLPIATRLIALKHVLQGLKSLHAAGFVHRGK